MLITNYVENIAKMNKKKHLSCKNCNRKCSVKFKNDLIFCFGLVKKLYKSTDCYRYCIIKNKTKNCTEIMLEEIYTLIRGLSELLITKRIEETNKK